MHKKIYSIRRIGREFAVEYINEKFEIVTKRFDGVVSTMDFVSEYFSELDHCEQCLAVNCDTFKTPSGKKVCWTCYDDHMTKRGSEWT